MENIIEPSTINQSTGISITNPNEAKQGNFRCYIVNPVVKFIKFIVDSVCYIGSKILELFKVALSIHRLSHEELIQTLYNQSYLKRLIDGLDKEIEEIKTNGEKPDSSEETDSYESESFEYIKLQMNQINDRRRRRQKFVDQDILALASKKLHDKLSDEQLRKIIQMTNKPVYKRAWRMEESTYYPVIQIFASPLFSPENAEKMGKNPKRTQLFNQLIENTEAVDRQVSLMKMWSIDQNENIKKIFADLPGSEMLEQQLYDDTQENRDIFHSQLLNQMRKTYAKMSDNDLKAYVNIHSSPAMYQLNKNITELTRSVME
ncbi:MAG: hypothetical protein KAG53_11605 [Endozoicomonadaceae bacterium]|nr:hypothetical protein [Endozoicomonadaceae bacterium]